ncbi:glycoside hydrolase domain-containing protein [Streptomyces sp. Q6]|uniref:Glycoside hydrolase domain-containing protein n=1 Tax=Streptomyces citrinus TaxID=3118173 RepID=A0ACD5AMQ4_9ACTN
MFDGFPRPAALLRRTGALDLYPKAPGTADLLLGAPLFPHAVVDRPGRTDLVIDAPDAGATRPYVAGVRVDGRDHPKSWTDAGFLRTGGTLAHRLTDRPDTGWATDPQGLPR